jgi:hypothetical protein
MSTDEAVVYIHGEMETIRNGDKTHQAVQTNLADVICGGKTNFFAKEEISKMMFFRSSQRQNFVRQGEANSVAWIKSIGKEAFDEAFWQQKEIVAQHIAPKMRLHEVVTNKLKDNGLGRC